VRVKGWGMGGLEQLNKKEGGGDDKNYQYLTW